MAGKRKNDDRYKKKIGGQREDDGTFDAPINGFDPDDERQDYLQGIRDALNPNRAEKFIKRTNELLDEPQEREIKSIEAKKGYAYMEYQGEYEIYEDTIKLMDPGQALFTAQTKDGKEVVVERQADYTYKMAGLPGDYPASMRGEANTKSKGRDEQLNFYDETMTDSSGMVDEKGSDVSESDLSNYKANVVSRMDKEKILSLPDATIKTNSNGDKYLDVPFLDRALVYDDMEKLSPEDKIIAYTSYYEGGETASTGQLKFPEFDPDMWERLKRQLK